MKITDWIMYFAAPGVFALTASAVSSFGIDIFNSISKYLLVLFIGFMLQLCVVYPLFLRFFSKVNIVMLYSAIAEAMNQMCGSIATSMASLLSRPTDIGLPLINSKDRKTFEIPDELCNGTDIVKVTFRLTVEDLIDSELIQLYPISIVKQILKQEDI